MAPWALVCVGGLGCGSGAAPSDSSADADAYGTDTDAASEGRVVPHDGGHEAPADASDVDANETLPTDCGSTTARLTDLPADSLALDATYVYYTDQNGVKKVPRCGGPFTLLASITVDDTALGIAVHDADVYFALGGGSFSGGSIQRVPKIGGTPVPIATSVVEPWPVVVDDEAVYWVDYGNTKKRLLTGGPVIDFPKSGGGYAEMALDVVNVYWSQPDIGGVAKAGGTPFSLAPQMGWCVAADDAFVYWTTYRDTETLYKVSSAGGGAPVPLATSHDQRCLALDGDWVYWADDFVGVSRVPKSGGSSQVVAAGDATKIAIDGQYVFWTASDGVHRTPKPP